MCLYPLLGSVHQLFVSRVCDVDLCLGCCLVAHWTDKTERRVGEVAQQPAQRSRRKDGVVVEDCEKLAACCVESLICSCGKPDVPPVADDSDARIAIPQPPEVVERAIAGTVVD